MCVEDGKYAVGEPRRADNRRIGSLLSVGWSETAAFSSSLLARSSRVCYLLAGFWLLSMSILGLTSCRRTEGSQKKEMRERRWQAEQE
jgi:hypothetical protein